MPHDHGHVLAEYHLAGPEHIQQAIEAAAAARREWSAWPWEDRAAVLLRAAELLATSWRPTINAATMLGQSKTVFQAEIDAASEMIDFWRFNTYFAQELYSEQPFSGPGRVELDGVPQPRRVHLRRVAVQLHRDRRQPDDRAGAARQHRDLEAGVERDAERLLHLQGARGRGAAAAASSISCRAIPSRSPTRCSTRRSSPASTSPAAPPSSTACGRRSARTSASTSPIRAWSAKPAARTSSSRTPPPIRRKSPSRSRAAGSSTRGRSARRRAASTSRSRSGSRSAIAPSRS